MREREPVEIRSRVDTESLKLEIKSKSDLVALFKKAGIDVKQQGKLHACICFHHDDGDPSLKIDNEKGLWNCYAEDGIGGDEISFYRLFYDLNYLDALLKLAEDLDINVEDFKRKLTPAEQEASLFADVYKEIFKYAKRFVQNDRLPEWAYEFWEATLRLIVHLPYL